MTDTTDLGTRVELRRESDFWLKSPWQSWISRTHKYLYMPVGKNACTRIKLTLHQLDGHQLPDDLGKVHDKGERLANLSTEEIVKIIASPEWFRFCFVRNPYYRLFSAYKSKILNFRDPQYQWVRDEIRATCGYPLRDGRPAGMVAFRDYVRFVRKSLDSVPDAHWGRQSDILMTDLIAYDFVGRVETFQEDFRTLLLRLQAPERLLDTVAEVINPTTKMYHAAVYDHEFAACVYEMYKADFEAFDYHRDSWLFDYE